MAPNLYEMPTLGQLALISSVDKRFGDLTDPGISPVTSACTSTHARLRLVHEQELVRGRVLKVEANLRSGPGRSASLGRREPIATSRAALLPKLGRTPSSVRWP